jgi:AbrB family looped-hinge helix DNA binding protein
MSTARLTSKGQLVIPKDIREHMRLQPGDRLDFIIQDDGEVVIRPMVTDVRELKGILQVSGRQPVSVAAMNEAVRKRVRAKQR